MLLRFIIKFYCVWIKSKIFKFWCWFNRKYEVLSRTPFIPRITEKKFSCIQSTLKWKEERSSIETKTSFQTKISPNYLVLRKVSLFKLVFFSKKEKEFEGQINRNVLLNPRDSFQISFNQNISIYFNLMIYLFLFQTETVLVSIVKSTDFYFKIYAYVFLKIQQ